MREDRLQQWMERHGSTLVERVAGEGEAEKVEADAEEEWQKVSAVDVAFPVDDPDSSRTLRDEERLAEYDPQARLNLREVAAELALLLEELPRWGRSPGVPPTRSGTPSACSFEAWRCEA